MTVKELWVKHSQLLSCRICHKLVKPDELYSNLNDDDPEPHCEGCMNERIDRTKRIKEVANDR